MTETAERLRGASGWEQELYSALRAHEREEAGVIAAYSEYAAQSPSATVRYLISMILEDEHRHHKVLDELANAVRADATMEETGPRVPLFDVHSGDGPLLEATRRFIALERQDREELKHLSGRMHKLGGELDAFVLQLLLADTDRHLSILRFIERLVRRSPLR